MSKSAPRVMVLDGDYTHTLAIQAELKRWLGAMIHSVVSSTRSPGFRSRFTDVAHVLPPVANREFRDELLRLVIAYEPDIIVPVGFASFAHTIALSKELPPAVRVLVPDAHEFEIATSKTRTYAAALEIGVSVPEEYTQVGDELRADQDPAVFPVFAKARYEQGGVTTALIRTEAEFRAFDPETIGGDVIFQEYIPGGHTYAQCGYYEAGEPIVAFQHVELRSVPRRGGSGTRVKVVHEPVLAELANRLLKHLRWTGVAQVEFKRSMSGEFVLMEINPKFWASYALADRSGHPVAATAVARILERDFSAEPLPRVGTSVVFPIRELIYTLMNWRQENFLANAFAMIWPPARPDFDLRDVWAHVPRRRR